MTISYTKETLKRPYLYMIITLIIGAVNLIKYDISFMDLFDKLFVLVVDICACWVLLKLNNKSIKELKYKTCKRLTI